MATSFLCPFLGLLGWFLLLPGALSALGAAWLLAVSLNLVGDMRSAQGRVVALVPGTVGTQGRLGQGSKSVVEFTAHDGRTLHVTDPVLRRLQAEHAIGEAVTVRYPAKDPLQAEISSSRWIKSFIGIAMLLAGLVATAVGGLLLRLRPKPVMAAPAS
ncbi:DUF3592 domain-containing protein [Acidovorax sp. LjRoot66]|uniref:DUF3592 domain-containing protein n=1 Tax=Acidovorax sp. LjRoot66 TaxID=3342334 RepID=UPI003ECE1E5A